MCFYTYMCGERERNQERTERVCVLIKRDLAGRVNAALQTQLRTDLKKIIKPLKPSPFFLSFPLMQAASQTINPEFGTKGLAETLEGKRQERREEEQREGQVCLQWGRTGAGSVSVNSD